jgi:chemotaxis protein MotA
MFAIIGIVVVFGAVLGGYLMEKGNILVLLQPSELVIIAGAAMGTILISNRPHILKGMVKGIRGVFGESEFSTKHYLDSLKMLYDVFSRARRDGLVAVEADIEHPEKSKLFSVYPAIAKNEEVIAFICDTLRTAASTVVDPFDLDQMMELDMDVRHHDATQPVSSLSTMADSLPGIGIVAAVLGVVITMGALGGPPEEIGHKVAAALVGTFLGILLCYGLVGPLASSMAKTADEERAYYYVLRVCIASFVKGVPPIMAIEMARRAIPGHVRPAFLLVETTCRSKTAPGAAKAAPGAAPAPAAAAVPPPAAAPAPPPAAAA